MSDYQKMVTDQFIEKYTKLDSEIPDDLVTELVSEVLTKALKFDYSDMTREVAQSAIAISLENFGKKTERTEFSAEDFQDIVLSLIANLFAEQEQFLTRMKEQRQTGTLN